MDGVVSDLRPNVLYLSGFAPPASASVHETNGYAAVVISRHAPEAPVLVVAEFDLARPGRSTPCDTETMAEEALIAGPETSRPLITAESPVNETMARFPSTAEVFVQHGPLFETRPGDVYLAYRGWTVGEFAAKRRLDLARLLQQLNAEADGAGRGGGVDAPGEPRAHRWPPGFARVAIGYTGSYEERDDVEIAEVSVVDAQTARGPE